MKSNELATFVLMRLRWRHMTWVLMMHEDRDWHYYVVQQAKTKKDREKEFSATDVAGLRFLPLPITLVELRFWANARCINEISANWKEFLSSFCWSLYFGIWMSQLSFPEQFPEAGTEWFFKINLPLTIP